MKRLVLVRHGKSSWKHSLPDEERPLKKRGYKDGNLVATTFKEFFQPPAMFWSSPAVRAHETAKIFKTSIPIPDEKFKVVEDLYTFNSSEVLSIIRSCPDMHEQLVVFGHNPALTNLVNKLGDKTIENLPTTGLCVIDFDIERWKDLQKGRIILSLLPKNLR